MDFQAMACLVSRLVVTRDSQNCRLAILFTSSPYQMSLKVITGLESSSKAINMSHQTVLSKCLIKISHKKISSKCVIKMLIKCFIDMSHENVS